MASVTRGVLRSFLSAPPDRRGRGARLFGSSRVTFDEGKRPGGKEPTEAEEALFSYADLYRHSFVEHAAKLGLNSCETGLTHVDEQGRANMVDVSNKGVTVRTARAAAEVDLGKEAFQLVSANAVQKGDVLSVAEIAGVLGAKKTPDLIPLCHSLGLTKVSVRCRLSTDGSSRILVECEAKCVGRTGVEMEALTGAAVAALTVYDMCKAVNKAIRIDNIRLVSKSGGKSDYSEPPLS